MEENASEAKGHRAGIRLSRSDQVGRRAERGAFALAKVARARVSGANVVGTWPFAFSSACCEATCVQKNDLRSKLIVSKLAKEKKRLLREERKAYIKEKYGFRLGKKPETPEEIEGRKQYDRDMEAAMRERRRDKIRVYNREYRRKKRAEALAVEQEKWSSAQWEEYNKRMANKAYPKGSPQWLIKEVVCYLATVQDLPEDAVTARLIELGGMDFLMKGAESMGKSRCGNSSTVLAAVRALALYLDPDNAAMFARPGSAGERGTVVGERRSPDGDTQNLANTNVPTTPPLRDGYGTIGICQGA